MAREKEIAAMLDDSTDYNVSQVRKCQQSGSKSQEVANNATGSNGYKNLIRNLYNVEDKGISEC